LQEVRRLAKTIAGNNKVKKCFIILIRIEFKYTQI